jgi:hypothetical protein
MNSKQTDCEEVRTYRCTSIVETNERSCVGLPESQLIQLGQIAAREPNTGPDRLVIF